MKLKFENVDVEQCLRSVMERNTKHYQSDFEFDVGSMERIAQTKHPERTPLYWDVPPFRYMVLSRAGYFYPGFRCVPHLAVLQRYP